MNRQEILSMFSRRAPELIKKWPEGKAPLDVPQGENRDALIAVIRAEHERKKITSVLDVGCGLGRWARFWLDGIGAGRWVGVEPVAALAAEAERRVEPLAKTEVQVGELPQIAAKWHTLRRFDAAFTFTVLEHIPAGELGPVVEVIKGRCKRLIAVEAVAGNCFCDYVFRHDYRALFGEPDFQRMLDKNKALMVWRKL